MKFGHSSFCIALFTHFCEGQHNFTDSEHFRYHKILSWTTAQLFVINVKENFQLWLSVVLNRHFELLNAIFMKDGIFSDSAHFNHGEKKNHAKTKWPNNNHLTLKVFFQIFRTRLIDQKEFWLPDKLFCNWFHLISFMKIFFPEYK